MASRWKLFSRRWGWIDSMRDNALAFSAERFDSDGKHRQPGNPGQRCKAARECARSSWFVKWLTMGLIQANATTLEQFNRPHTVHRRHLLHVPCAHRFVQPAALSFADRLLPLGTPDECPRRLSRHLSSISRCHHGTWGTAEALHVMRLLRQHPFTPPLNLYKTP